MISVSCTLTLYNIVTQGHGGTLTVESTEGKGATFIVTLPTKSTEIASSA